MPLKVKAKEQMQKIGTYAGKYRYVMMPERMAIRTQARMVVRAQEITAAATPTHPEATWTSSNVPQKSQKSQKFYICSANNWKCAAISVISICLANTGCAAISAISAISAGHKKKTSAQPFLCFL